MGSVLQQLRDDLAAIDLVGPHGYTHGWVYHGPGRGTRAHTGRLVSRDVRTQQGRLRNASPSLTALRATAALRGKKGSDYQHLAAARLHAAAARSAGSAALRARHERMAAMHRGIAARTPGRGTRSEGPLRRPGAKAAPVRRRPPGEGMATKSERKAAGQYSKPIGPNIGELGKAARGSNKNLRKAGRQTAYKAGHALPPPSKGAAPGFPVTSPKSWEDARRAVGRVKSPARRAALAGLLRRTAAQYGKTKALKASWAASNTGPALEFAMELPAISSPYDVMIVRAEDGSGAVIRHRRGGGEIGSIRRTDAGWVASRAGRDLGPHTRQRGALLELIGTHNRDAGTPFHRPAARQPSPPLQSRPVQTPLMQRYGIPAISTLATPARGASDGGRVTGREPDSDDLKMLSPKGKGIYKKLRSRGFPHARAHNFARRAQNRGGS